MWINVAERTGIAELRLTTRDIPDYDVLMKRRLGILDQHGLGLPKIQEVIAGMDPLPGAKAFLDALRERYQVIILSDTFYEFAEPFMRKLGWPTLFCHSLEVEPSGRIAGYRCASPIPSARPSQALRGLNFQVVAAGDSYNDTTMLGGGARRDPLPRPRQRGPRLSPALRVSRRFEELRAQIDTAFDRCASSGCVRDL